MPQRYSAMDVDADALAATLRELASEGAGGNVTIPHKEAVASLAVRCTPIAQRVGAVNTFWFENGALVGHNTDVEGVERALDSLLAASRDVSDDAPHRMHRTPARLDGVRCALLGAGGSAGAALVALDRLGAADVRLWSRTAERARALSARVGRAVTVCSTAEEAVQGAEVVINATPIGLSDATHPVPPAALDPRAAVLDLVYRPGETNWVRASRARGLRAQDGLLVLVEQGAAAFRSWFGVEPSRDAMWAALEARPG